jgi:hypothetical protein
LGDALERCGETGAGVAAREKGPVAAMQHDGFPIIVQKGSTCKDVGRDAGPDDHPATATEDGSGAGLAIIA